VQQKALFILQLDRALTTGRHIPDLLCSALRSSREMPEKKKKCPPLPLKHLPSYQIMHPELDLILFFLEHQEAMGMLL